MKYFFVIALLISVWACSSKKPNTEGLKSIIEQKTGVTFKVASKSDTSETLYYVQQEKDLAKGLGRFDSTKAACISYFNSPGTFHEIADKAFFQWNKDGFFAVLVSALDKDSNVVFRVATSTRPIPIGEFRK
jgi:hypothetical protein